MAVLLLAEIAGGALALDATAKAVTAAKSLGDVTVLVAGPAAAGQAASQIDGVAKVVVADDAAYANGLAEPVADLVVSLAGNYEHIVAPSTASAKNILPRVAALLDVMVLSDVTAILDGSTFERPIYAGNAMQTVKSNDSKKLLTVRTTAFDAAGQGGSAAVEAIAAAGNAGLSAWVEDKVAASDRPELTSAKIVVSGGRGVGSEENFARTTVRRYPAEVIIDAAHRSLAGLIEFADTHKSTRSVGMPGVESVHLSRNPGHGERFLKLFGKPARLTSSDAERNDETTLAQVFELTGGETLNRLLRQDNNRIGRQIKEGNGDAEIVDALYWAILTRAPSANESTAMLKYLSAAGDRRGALEDVAWGLLNAKEFILRR